MPLRLKRIAGFMLALLLSLLLGLVWLAIGLWFSSPHWAPVLAERAGQANGVSLKISGMQRPTLEGLRVGQLQLVNETLALTINNFTAELTHPEAPQTSVARTLLHRLLPFTSNSQALNTDLILLRIHATRLDLHAGGHLPAVLAPMVQTPEPPESLPAQAKANEPDGRKLARLFEALGPQRNVRSQPEGPLPDLDLPFGIRLDTTLLLDHLQVTVDVGEAGPDAVAPEQLSFLAQAFSVEARGLASRPMSLTLATAGELSLPSGLRQYGDEGDTLQAGALSFSLDQRFPLSVEGSVDHEAIRLDVSSRPLTATLVLGHDGTDAEGEEVWRLSGNMALTTAGLSPGFLLPATAPVFPQPLPLQVNNAAIDLDVDLRLNDRLLPHHIQPERAHFSADATLDAGGPPGRLRFSQTLRLGREAEALKLETSTGIYNLDPVAAWWKKNAWFKSTGLQSSVLQPWRVEQRAINCRIDHWQAAGSGLPDCNWPLKLSVKAGKSRATLELTPTAERHDKDRSAGGFSLPTGLRVKLISSGEQLHQWLPNSWALNGQATVMRPQTAANDETWQIDLKQAALSLNTLNLPDVQIDRLNLKLPRLLLRIPQQLMADGTTALLVESITGSGAAELDVLLRSALLPVSDPLPVVARFALETLESPRVGVTEVQLDVETLELAGLTLKSKLRVVPDERSMKGTLRLTGQPDKAMLNAILLEAVGEAVPGLDLSPGKLLYKGVVDLAFAGPQPVWSTEGLLGLQQWQVTTEKAEAKRLTVSASLAATEQRVQVFSDGEALSTVSADLTLLGLPFPAAFVKLTTDLAYGPGLPAGSEAGIAGTITISEARIGAFLGEVSLGSALTLPLPLSRVSETEPLRIPLRLRGIDLGALVALENEHIDATGSISGRLGLVYTGSSVQIPASAPGQVSADGGGRIRLKEAGQWQSMAGGNPQLLFAVGALGNFQYDSLKTSVIFDDDEWLKLGLELRGRNPEVMDARPIHYNLNVETNILSLLQSLEMTKNLSETLEQRLLKAYE